jgi:oligopeptide/dipeptide ABC transporter ATP-binding protein
MVAPKHPYTQALLSAIPRPGEPRGERVRLSGELPDPADPPPGCVFHTRCPRRFEPCDRVVPILAPPEPGTAAAGAGEVACHLYRTP